MKNLTVLHPCVSVEFSPSHCLCLPGSHRQSSHLKAMCVFSTLQTHKQEKQMIAEGFGAAQGVWDLTLCTVHGSPQHEIPKAVVEFSVCNSGVKEKSRQQEREKVKRHHLARR